MSNDTRVSLTIGLNTVLYKSLQVIADLHGVELQDVITNALIDYSEKTSKSLDFLASFTSTKQQ